MRSGGQPWSSGSLEECRSQPHVSWSSSYFCGDDDQAGPGRMIGRGRCRLRDGLNGKGACQRPHRAAPLLQTASRSAQGLWANQRAHIVFWRSFWAIFDGEEPRSERRQRHALTAGTCWHLAPPPQLPGHEGPIAAHANLPRQLLMLATGSNGTLAHWPPQPYPAAAVAVVSDSIPGAPCSTGPPRAASTSLPAAAVRAQQTPLHPPSHLRGGDEPPSPSFPLPSPGPPTSRRHRP